MRHERAKAEVQEALKRYRPPFKEWNDLAMPLLSIGPPLPEDQVRAV